MMLTVSAFKKPVFMLPCPPVGAVRGYICRKKTFDRIILAASGVYVNDTAEIMAETAPDADRELLGITGTFCFLRAYRDAVESYCEENIDVFGLPEAFGSQYGERCRLPVITYGERMVYEHSGLSFSEISELDVLDYRMLLADAVKYKVLNRQDGKGREYLNECYDFMHRKSNLFD